MKRLFKLSVILFALVGVIATAGAGFTYVTYPELVAEFWSVRADIGAVPAERRKEVVSELPARITFEREVRQDMSELPEERQAELYAQLTNSRDQVFEQFRQRITREAEIVRQAREAELAAGELTERIRSELGDVRPSVDLGGTGAPALDPLADVNEAASALAESRLAFGDARNTGDMTVRVEAAVEVLEALDRLGDQVAITNRAELNERERRRLGAIVMDARATLYDMRQTPGLSSHPRAMQLLASIPPKLTTEP